MHGTRTPDGGGGDGRDRGQVTVEFVGMLPIVLVVLALMWQFVLIGYTFTLAGHAADRGAREAAVGGDCAGEAGEDLPGAWRSSARIDCGAGGGSGMVAVTVGLKVPVLFPGGANLPMTVTGRAGAVKEERR